jgi:hypothetical protein
VRPSAPLRALLWLVAPVLLLLALWVTADRAPRLPDDGDHRPGQAEAICLGCHGHTARRPRPADHPLRDDCYSCHRDAAGALHARDGAATEIPGGWRDDPRLAR